jgi:hydrogenase expression/formation protein HypC
MCLAIPGKIVKFQDSGEDSALVEVLGVRRTVDMGLLSEDRPQSGDWVLIHVGFAMSRISEQDAMDQLRMLTALGEVDAATQEVTGYAVEDSEDP